MAKRRNAEEDISGPSEQIIKLYAQGLTLQQVAVQTGRNPKSYKAVANVLRRVGVVVRKRSE